MNTQNTLTIHGLSTSIAYCEAKGLANVFEAYSEHCTGQEIFEVGFNQYTGYVYIALENGVQIASAFGRGVEYIVNNFETGEEYFLDSYSEALEKLESLTA
jgi:hypothetical protein